MALLLYIIIKIMYYIFVLFYFCLVCMAINNGGVQYDGGFLPDILLLT